MFNLICRLRQTRLPEPAQAPNAGSFFKNPVITADQFNAIKQRYTGVQGYEQQNQQVKISAAWLIQQLGYAGQLVGCLRIPEKTSLAFINEGAGDGKAILEAAQHIQTDIWQSFHIKLEIEPVHQY